MNQVLMLRFSNREPREDAMTSPRSMLNDLPVTRADVQQSQAFARRFPNTPELHNTRFGPPADGLQPRDPQFQPQCQWDLHDLLGGLLHLRSQMARLCSLWLRVRHSRRLWGCGSRLSLV